MGELHEYDVAVRMHESIKRAAKEVAESVTPNTFIGWVIDSRFDSDPNHGPLDVDNIGEPGTFVKVATINNPLYDDDGNPVLANDGRVLTAPDRSKGVIRALMPGNRTPLMDATAVLVEGNASTQYRIRDILQTPYIGYFNNTYLQAVTKIKDTLMYGRRTGLMHTYDEFDYPLGNDPFHERPAKVIVNLCTTPGFENGIGAWAATAGSSIAASTSFASKGTHSGAVTFAIGDGSARITLAFTTEVGKTYTLVFKGKGVGTKSSTYVGMGDGAAGPSFNQTLINNAANFDIFVCQYTAQSTTSSIVIFPDVAETTSGVHCYVDELMITEGTDIYTPFDGSDVNASWTGTADQSISTKAIAAVPPVFPPIKSVIYGTPIYVPFYSDVISVGQNYYLGTWSREGWDNTIVLSEAFEVPGGMLELTVKLWAGNDTSIGGGTISDPTFNDNFDWVIKKYTVPIYSVDYIDSGDWLSILPHHTTGPVNKVDFQMEVSYINRGAFALRINFTRDDYAPARAPKFIGSVSGWVDIENIQDVTELDPNTITSQGHRGRIRQSFQFNTFQGNTQGVGSINPYMAKGPFMSPSYAFPHKAQFSLMGGGTWTYDGVNLKWTDELLVMGLGRNIITADGWLQNNIPFSGTQTVLVFGKAGVSSVVCSASGVPLAPGQALYWELNLGGKGDTGASSDWRIVDKSDITQQFEAPAHWILIAAVSPDGKYCKLGTGQTIISTAVTPFGWSDWTAIPLGANVTYSDTLEYRPAYRYNTQLRKGELRGLIRPTVTISTNELVGTLPVAARPQKICIMLGAVSASSALSGRLDINTNGELRERASPALTTAQFISLDGMNYSLDADV